ncbi:MAG TPA: family 78 glycoside hydrolase catalytic domain, partial [Sunxiuqinia sp.]|nr:family 78 glycoside hydrolase catalytic domain [Sunxiuqinia sp.]
MKNSLILIVLLAVLLAGQPIWAQISLNNLKCEMLTNPLGIDAKHPRLSWQIESSQRGTLQKAYQILVASSKEKLDNNEGDLWDSGKMDSDKSLLVGYNGKQLQSREDCFWKVKVWTNKGESDWSEPAHWGMGFLYYKDWWGRWIGFDYAFPWDSNTFHSRLSARYFRKEFEVKKPIKEARAYIMGVGLYELYFNGEKIGDKVLAPTPTDYTKNVKYNAFDVTKELQSGENAVGVILGNGRYYEMRQYKPYKVKTFGYPKLLMQLEIEYEDGSKDVLKTDDSWKGTADGPIRSNNEYDGEDYDARKEMPGWSKVGFDDSKWLQADYVQQPRGEYEAQMNPNMKVMQTIHPIGIKKLSPGKYILDMGQNMVGWLKMKVNGAAGDTVQLRFAEILKDDGEIFTANLRDAEQTDHYVLKGGGTETWAPRFVYHGFRYVEINGYPGEPKLENFEGEVVYDEMAKVGTFETSNALINQIYKNAYWGIRGNYKGMPVDCPQRNERQPWLGDRSTGCYGESFVFNNGSLYAKWVDDIGYSQKEDGCIGDVAPAFWRYYSDNMTWRGTYLMVADMLYRQYGDVKPIEKHYQSMKKWLQYMKDRYMTDDFIVTKDSYGDWCAPPVT